MQRIKIQTLSAFSVLVPYNCVNIYSAKGCRWDVPSAAVFFFVLTGFGHQGCKFVCACVRTSAAPVNLHWETTYVSRAAVGGQATARHLQTGTQSGRGMGTRLRRRLPSCPTGGTVSNRNRRPWGPGPADSESESQSRCGPAPGWPAGGSSWPPGTASGLPGRPAGLSGSGPSDPPGGGGRAGPAEPRPPGADPHRDRGAQAARPVLRLAAATVTVSAAAAP